MRNRKDRYLWLFVCLLLVATPAIAQRTANLEVGQYALRAETLSSPECREIYLRLIENFVGWTEHSGRFVHAEELESGVGYFDAAGNGVTWARGNSNLCLAYAVLLTTFPERETFSIHSVPRSQLQVHLRQTIRALCLSNKNCSRHKPSGNTWGGPSWQAALEIIGAAWAAHLCQEQLDADTLAMMRQVVCCEADNLDKKIPSSRFDNTGAEDCCWNAPLLAFAANIYADNPRASHWDMLCRKWAFNAASVAADADADQVLDGRPLKDWIVSENLHPDLTLDNHAMWSVGYQCSQQHFGEAELAYRLFGRAVPAALAHHADQMWRDVTSALFLWDGDMLYPHGQDWSWKVYSSIEYLCWQHCCRRNRAAGAIESRALQMIYRRQLALGTGDLGAAVSGALDFGNQTVKPKRWAFCYLMHKHLGAPERTAYSDAEQDSRGVHIYPHTKVAIHRTREKCISVSWHPRHQPIYMLPEGDSTFVDPPFFFPYDRDSGCVHVRPQMEARSKHKNPRHPADYLVDGDASTFWVSGAGNSQRGHGPTAERPDWVLVELPRPITTTTLLLRSRVNYGPRQIELQTPMDGQQEFRTIARFTASNEPEQSLNFPETTSRVFRVVILSSYDPRYPDEPRNAQIREIEFLAVGNDSDPKTELASLELCEATATHGGKGMRVSYRKPHSGGITQYLTINSFPGETTVYCTVFRAARTSTAQVGHMFPLRTAAPPGFEKAIRQYRGDRWLNMSDHIGFVSVDPLPKEIPNDRFLLTENQTFEVRPGEWFGRAVLAVYARQSHEQTARVAPTVRLLDNSRPEAFKLTLDTETGSNVLEFDFARMAPSR